MPAMESNNLGGMDDLLKPGQFDWADDVEENFSDDTASDDSMSDDDVEETRASFYKLERQPNSRGHDRAADMEDDNSETELPVAEDSVAAPVGPLLVNGTASGLADSDDSSGSEVDEEIESMQGDVNREFSSRRACMASDNDGEIHHFKWLGLPIFGYSATPAAISLLFLLSEPKVPAIGDEWRQESIMRRAMVFVDPVIVYLDDSGWSSLCLRGYDLVQWATGKAFKFYSPHGHWAQDGREAADDSAIDDGNLGNYVAENVATGNGFTHLFSIRSRVQWQSSRDENFYRTYKERSTAARRRMRHRGFNPSPLRQSMVPDDFEDEIEEIEKECNAIVGERLISRLSRKRSFYRGLSKLSSFRGHSSIDDNESDSDTSSDTSSEDSDEDERRSAIGYSIQLSDSEREEAERRKTRMVAKKGFKASLNTIEDENSHEDQNGHRGHQHRISSGTHTLNGPLGSETVLHDSNERSGEETNFQEVASASQTHGASRDRKNKWKKNLRRISYKARNTLRFKDARLSLVSKLSDSIDSSPSEPEPENGTDTPSRRNAIIENIFEPLNYGFSGQYASFPTPRFGGTGENEEPPRASSKFITKLKNAFHRSSAEHATTAAPKNKRSSFSDSFKEVWFSGFWAMVTYPMVMM